MARMGRNADIKDGVSVKFQSWKDLNDDNEDSEIRVLEMANDDLLKGFLKLGFLIVLDVDTGDDEGFSKLN
ncbi:hypothetical protein Tco_1299801 [Tanacetum coccineum]